MGIYSTVNHRLMLALFLLAAVFTSSRAALALAPDEVLVVANRNAARSIGLAKYYMQRRGIPEAHLVAVWVTDAETCTREAYDKKVVPPIQRWLAAHSEAPIRCLVTVFGVPLKVAPPALPKAKKPRAVKAPPAPAQKTPQGDGAGDGAVDDARPEAKKTDTKVENAGASLDSELALIKAGKYPLHGWRPNPFFIGNQRQDTGIDRNDVLMVSRLDGPSAEIVKRIIDGSLATEKEGLSGKAYFDARWPRPPDDRPVRGYTFYDRSIHRAADRLRESGRMPVRLDDRPELFQPGDGPQAALYCGWYSLAHYVDAFSWQRGAVGYHIASGECATLRNPKSQVWCVKMLEKGVAATVGPVAEPYVQAFPVPELFFGFLVDGYLSLAECYMVSLPSLSWQMVLVGDPLYRPFKAAVSP